MDPALLERVVLAFTGVCFSIFGILTGVIWSQNLLVDLYPGVWPVVFLAAGLTTIWWALDPVNANAYRVSGTLGICALIARAVNCLYVLSNTVTLGSQPTTYGRLLLPVVAYLLLAVLVAFTWYRLWPRQLRVYGEP